MQQVSRFKSNKSVNNKRYTCNFHSITLSIKFQWILNFNNVKKSIVNIITSAKIKSNPLNNILNTNNIHIGS